ncbi:MAG: nucleotidyltransferase family protein [Candidatus Zixiibacteriota bacterium]
MDDIIKALRKDMPELASRYGVKRLALFGSFARGEQKRTSDVDVVVELKRPLGLEFVDLAERLKRVLGRRVDLLTPAGLKSIRVPSVRKRMEESLVYV